jgi:hypothetical protein
MSSIAVFLVLGGGAAFAATKLAKNSVGTKQLKNNSVTTAKIKNDAVTGAKVKESSLGTVPSATNATNASNAANANDSNTVAGSTIRRFFYAANETSAKSTILSLDGLTLTASCEGGFPQLIATTSVNHSLIHAGGTYGFVEPFYQEDDDFETGEEFEPLFEEYDSVQGTLTYAQPSGTVVTATFESEEEGLANFETDCIVSGSAIG